MKAALSIQGRAWTATVTVLAAIALAPAAFAQTGSSTESESTAKTTTGTTTNTAAQPGNTDTQKLTDNQIAMVLMTADTAEVNQAKLAEQKTQNKQIKKFAGHMAKAHSQHESSLAKFDQKKKMTPEESQLSQTLTTQTQQTTTQLEGMNGKDFDKSYVDAMVQEHQAVLDTLNNQLIPNAQNPQLKGMLQKTAKVVSKHLEMAKKLQSSISAG